MGNKSLKVLIIGLGYPVAPFILRRLQSLDAHGVTLIIVCRRETVDYFKDFENASIFIFHRFMAPHIFLASLLLCKALFRLPRWPSMWKYADGKSVSAKFKWLIENCQLLSIPQPDIIHSQWLAPAFRFKLFMQIYPNTPLLISARGSQVTVRARADQSSEHFFSTNFKQADFVHCVSNDIATRCRALGAPIEKLFVNYNGINLSTYKPGVFTPASKTLRIISVGALIWRKGYWYQLQVMKELASRGVEASLYIIGSGADEAGLKYTAHRLGVNSQVFFEGQKNQDEIISKLQASDVYLATSAAEGLPNSLVEAAACGLPIVTFACEGAHEIIEQDVTGYVVEFGLVGELVNKIVALQDESLRQHMGALAREKMEKEFNEDYWVNEMVHRYNQITLHAR